MVQHAGNLNLVAEHSQMVVAGSVDILAVQQAGHSLQGCWVTVGSAHIQVDWLEVSVIEVLHSFHTVQAVDSHSQLGKTGAIHIQAEQLPEMDNLLGLG
ncbi:hypothetical protein OIU76_008964 [Salix suchowensis]|nr:hypothetical protein OIU76_008964 [Salix suchowensis]